jgi:hypothetical protein
MVADGRHLDLAAHAKRLRTGQLVAELLQAAATRAGQTRAAMRLAAWAAARGARTRRGHRH